MYKDNNGDGIPDAFENRKPISEILNEEVPTQTLVHDSDLERLSARGILWRLTNRETSYRGKADYGEYRLHIPTEGGAVMLEIKNGESFVACVFRSELQIQEFISQFDKLRADVFVRAKAKSAS